MTKLLSYAVSPIGHLYTFLLFTQSIRSLYFAFGREIPPSYETLYYLAFPNLIGWWLQQDGKNYGIKWVYDTGLFMYLAWPVIVPYYLFKTRGARALLTILGLIGVYLGVAIIGALVYVFRS